VIEGKLHAADVDTLQTIELLKSMWSKYPQLSTMTFEELNSFQMKVHKKWASNFNKYLLKNGKTPNISERWI
jgi:DNA polymerase-3 subunit epsilon